MSQNQIENKKKKAPNLPRYKKCIEIAESFAS